MPSAFGDATKRCVRNIRTRATLVSATTAHRESQCMFCTGAARFAREIPTRRGSRFELRLGRCGSIGLARRVPRPKHPDVPRSRSSRSFSGALVRGAVAAFVLTRQIVRIGEGFFTPGLLGILVALASDSPEITSAMTALATGQREMGVAVVLGSNVFNLAALLGVTAIVTGKGVVVERRSLLISGGAAILVTLAGALLVIQWLPGWAALAMAILVLVPYVVGSSLPPSVLETLPLPAGVLSFLCGGLAKAGRDAEPAPTAEHGDVTEAGRAAQAAPTAEEGGISGAEGAPVVILALAGVIGGSVAVVKSAVLLGGRWGVPHAITGVLGLAALTGVPNLIAAVNLSRHGRGTAVVSETLNSNSLNVVFGLCLPSVVMGGVNAPSTTAKIALGWLVAMTVLALMLVGRRDGLRWKGGVALVASYAAFVVAVLLVSA